MHKLSIVIPAYNEKQRIGNTLRSVIEYCKKNIQEYEIIVIDDGSRDGTSEVVNRYEREGVKLFHNRKNKGKGASIRFGILSCTLPYVLFMDADLSTPPKQIERLFEYMDLGYDIVIGSRRIDPSHVIQKQIFRRRILGKVFIMLTKLIAGGAYSDYLCGFKLFKSGVAKRLVGLQTVKRFSFDVELLYLARKFEYKVKEVPIAWEDKAGSTVRPLRDAFVSLYELCKIRINDILGKYS